MVEITLVVAVSSNWFSVLTAKWANFVLPSSLACHIIIYMKKKKTLHGNNPKKINYRG
jgi:uncharacterized membrane protein